MGSAATGQHPFPRLRWLGLAWLAVYLPSYTIAYGITNFLFLCNLGVMITAIALWRGDRLLLSSQAIAAPVIGIAWGLDAGWRVVTGAHLFGGTEYMWNPAYPLFTRLLSLYHLAWPVLVVACVAKVGYDRRGWRLQTAIAAAALIASRLLTAPADNVNFAFRDPLFGLALGPAPIHLATVLFVLSFVAYGATHAILARTLPEARTPSGRTVPETELELDPVELVREVEAGEPLQVLDVRAEQRLAAGRVDVVADERFRNIRGSRVLAAGDPSALGLDRTLPVAVVCARGNDSLTIARHLRGRGFDARTLRGGMLAWMAAQVARELEPPPSLDGLVQFDRIGKGALAYLLASDGEALVVDPPRHLAPIIALLERRGLDLVGVAETHVHADFLSGAAELARRFGVPHHLHRADAVSPYDGRAARIPFEDLSGLGPLRVGRARIEPSSTPGHTEGSVTFLVDGALALTGDFLFVDSVGRPDLGGRAEEWTEQLAASLERARREWPDGLRILPAHYAAEAERNGDRTVDLRFGAVRRRNRPLGLPDRDALRAWVRERATEVPEAYRRIKCANLGLETPDADEADVLEAGRNQCALA